MQRKLVKSTPSLPGIAVGGTMKLTCFKTFNQSIIPFQRGKQNTKLKLTEQIRTRRADGRIISTRLLVNFLVNFNSIPAVVFKFLKDISAS